MQSIMKRYSILVVVFGVVKYDDDHDEDDGTNFARLSLFFSDLSCLARLLNSVEEKARGRTRRNQAGQARG